MRDEIKQVLASILCGVVIVSAAAPTLAKIFWRQRGHAIVRTSQDWNRLFQTSVRINGSRGDLEILGCDTDLASVMRQLRRAYASDVKLMELTQNESMGRGVIQSDTGISRILVIGLDRHDQSVVFILTQSPDDYEKSLALPSGRGLREIPAYPGSVARTFVQVEETHAQLEVSVAPGNPEVIHAFFQSALARNGWKQMMPPANSDAGYSGLILYQKKFEICCVLVQPSRHPSESIITLLHKRLNVR